MSDRDRKTETQEPKPEPRVPGIRQWMPDEPGFWNVAARLDQGAPVVNADGPQEAKETPVSVCLRAMSVEITAEACALLARVKETGDEPVQIYRFERLVAAVERIERRIAEIERTERDQRLLEDERAEK